MILGMDTLERRLAALSTKLRAQALGEAVQAGGEVIARAARARAPRRTGHLAEEGIASEITNRSGTKAVAHVGPTKEAFYGRFVEKGTKFTKAQPFIRPAFDEQKDAAVREVERVLKSAVLLEVRR